MVGVTCSNQVPPTSDKQTPVINKLWREQMKYYQKAEESWQKYTTHTIKSHFLGAGTEGRYGAATSSFGSIIFGGKSMHISAKEYELIDSFEEATLNYILKCKETITLKDTTLKAGKTILLRAGHLTCKDSTIEAPKIILPAESDMELDNCTLIGEVSYDAATAEVD
jgi:hypothetical protein